MSLEKVQIFARSHKYLLITVVVVAIFAFAVMGVVHANSLNSVVLVVDGVEEKSYTAKETVGDFLKERNIKIDSNTFVSELQDALIEDKMKITIAYPKEYKIKIGNAESKVKSASSKVLDIVKSSGVILDSDDYTIPKLDERVKPTDIIEIYKVGVLKETVETAIPYSTVDKPNSSMNTGQMKVVREGEEGTKSSVYEVTVVNGVRTSKNLISENYTKAPVDKIVEKGTKQLVVATRSSMQRASIAEETGNPADVEIKGRATGNTLPDGTPYKKVMTMKATAYNNSPEQNGGWTTTALGTPLERGVIAVDPRVIPLGTKVYVASTDGSADYGYAIAADTGGAIKGNKIDLCMGSGNTRSFGIRQVKLYILD